MDVRFLRGVATAYAAIAQKDDKTFYYVTDEHKLYLGSVLLSNQVVEAEVDVLEARVKAVEDAGFQAQIDAINETLKSIATSDTVTAIDNRLKVVEGDYLKAADKTELEGKITAHETAVNTKFADYSTTEQMNAAIDADVKVVTDYIAENEAKWLEKTDISDLEQRMTAVEGVADAAQTAQEVSDAIDAKITALDLANTYDAKGAAATAEQNAKDYSDGRLNAVVEQYLTGEGAADTIDTLNEIANWINSDEAGATKIIADVAKNTQAIADEKSARESADNTINGEIDGIQAQLNGIAAGDGTVKAAIDAVDGKFADYTKTTDLGDLASKDEADLNLDQYAKTDVIADSLAKAVEAHSWGNHANAGYAKSADLGTAATANISTQTGIPVVENDDGLITAGRVAEVYNDLDGKISELIVDVPEVASRIDTLEEVVGDGFKDEGGNTVSVTAKITENAQICQNNFTTISNQLTWGEF